MTFLNGKGSIPMCATCPSAYNCCSRVNAEHGVDPPVVFPGEVSRIEGLTKLDPESFALRDPSGHYRWLKSTPTGCVFLSGGKCQVYEARPLDCRLFPLDVVRLRTGRIAWIAYTSVCPQEFDPNPLLAEAKDLLALDHRDFLAYAAARTPLLDQHDFTVLEYLDDSTNADFAPSGFPT